LASQLITHNDFQSLALGANRPVIVYLPPSYRSDTRRQFPLLILHDGQNVFDGRTSYVPGQYWRVREAADDLLERRRIEPLIIAAVYHGGEKRITEYTPTRTRRLGGGGADLHGRMLLEELRPFLCSRYRIASRANRNGLGGSSLGGLAALYLGLKYPQYFGRLAVMSPSVWWDQRVILKMLQSLDQPQRQRIWLDIGTAEGDAPFSSVRDVRLLRATLISKGWREGRTLGYVEAEGADHSERAWAARVPQMLEFLFPRKIL
jgi:predicted alpha/beta superfamily hydrolase